MSTAYLRSPCIEMAPLQDETILFDPGKNQFCVINRTASFIWNQLATPTTAENLATQVSQSFRGVALDDALRDTNRALEQLLSLNFVVGESTSGEKQ